MGNNQEATRRRFSEEAENNEIRSRRQYQNMPVQTNNRWNLRNEQLPQDQQLCPKFVQPCIPCVLCVPVGDPQEICPTQTQIPDYNLQPLCYPQQPYYQQCNQLQPDYNMPPCNPLIQQFPQPWPQTIPQSTTRFQMV